MSIFDRVTDNVANSWSRSLERLAGRQAMQQNTVQDPMQRFGYGFQRIPDPMQRFNTGIVNPFGSSFAGGFGVPDPMANFQPNRFAGLELMELGRQRRAEEAAASQGTAGPGTPGQGRGLDGTWQWKDTIDQVAQETGVPTEVIQSIMGIESGGNQYAYSPAGAQGLMQVMPNYWQDLANQYGGNLYDPYTNIRTGAQILKMNFEQYGSWDKAAAAYLGAIDEYGNITGAPDAHGTTGYTYVDLFNQNLYALQNQGPQGTGTAGPMPPGSVVFPVQGYSGNVELHWGEHPGAADIFADYGTPVLAIQGGYANSGYSDIGGYWTLITANDGTQFYYAHMDRMGPSGYVQTGQQIGGVGDTGNAKGTGPHLHLGIGTEIYTGTGPSGGAGNYNVIQYLQNAYRY